MRNVEVAECLFVRPPDGTSEQTLECSDIRCGSDSRHPCTRTLHLGRFGMGFALYLVTSCFGIARAFYRAVQNVAE